MTCIRKCIVNMSNKIGKTLISSLGQLHAQRSGKASPYFVSIMFEGLKKLPDIKVVHHNTHR